MPKTSVTSRVFSPRAIRRGALLMMALAAVLGVPEAPRLVAANNRVAETGLWLVPSPVPDESSDFARAVADYESNRAADALPVFQQYLTHPLLGGYARLYVGRAELALGRAPEALDLARALDQDDVSPALRDAARWLAADAADASENWTEAVRAYQALTASGTSHMAEAWLGLGRAAARARDLTLAATAYRKVYYEFPLTDQATEAVAALVELPRLPAAEAFTKDLGRAEALLAGHRYADAKKAFTTLRGRARKDDRALVDLRLAECEFYLRHYVAARSALKAYLGRTKFRAAEARFFYLSTIRELGHDDDYLSLVRAFVAANPKDPLAETALNDLGTYYIVQNDDEQAASVFAELYRRFPQGADAERAAWKAGWWAYKTGDFAGTIRIFGSAVSSFPHSDYRSAWVYWMARAHERAGQLNEARAGYAGVVADYRNSYYGLEAAARLTALSGARAAADPAPAPRDPPLAIAPGTPPPNAALIQALLTAGLYDDAVTEIRSVESRSGASPLLDATLAYALNRKGELRPAITAMRHAYPQFMADGGEALPRSILTIIFPVQYWDLIQQYATARGLDPFLMAALIAQESTFQADVRSSANAWGLMQLLPATGRRYAPVLDIRPFTTHRLTDPETNIKIGMAYFADLLAQFHDVAAALAAYNAGENRAERWMAERPGASQDEFIDDIPYPETQNYVKRVIGTAENYRNLYGGAAPLSAEARTSR